MNTENTKEGLNPKRFTRENRSIAKTSIPQGKSTIEVYKYRDALNFAHSVGLLSIKSELIPQLCDIDTGVFVARAVASFADGSEFTGIGDANPGNVNSIIAKHLPRMAETRAKARALGDALNLDSNFSDEFGGDDTEAYKPKPAAKPTATFNAPPANGKSSRYECEQCGAAITDSKSYSAEKKAELSIKQNGTILCWNCSH
jgi:hypothetical protein